MTSSDVRTITSGGIKAPELGRPLAVVPTPPDRDGCASVRCACVEEDTADPAAPGDQVDNAGPGDALDDDAAQALAEGSVVVLQRGDRVLLTVRADATEETANALDVGLRASFPGVLFVIAVGVTGVLVLPSEETTEA